MMKTMKLQLMASSVYIPEELLFEILKRLPVKSLCRFLSVSNSWSSLISSQSFCKTHRTTNTEEPTLYFRRDECIIHNQDETIIQKLFFPKPIHCRYSYIFLLEVIHGVFCYMYTDLTAAKGVPGYIVFWNPAIKKHVWGPLPLNDFNKGIHLLGAGFEASKNDFKAVWIPSNLEGAYYKVFSARKGSWTQRKMVYYSHLNKLTRGCFFDGAIYWVGESHELVYFECESEVFWRMELPEEVNGLHRVVVYDGFLTLVTSYTEGMGTTWTVWTMKEFGVWTKNLTVTHNVMGNDTCKFQETMLLLDIGQPCQDLVDVD